jgi:hypothetical protein
MSKISLSALTSSACLAPLAMACLAATLFAREAVAATPSWFVRLKLDNDAKGFKHHSSMLGQLANAQAGFDGQDLKGLAPFSAPFLYIAFPHADWGSRAGDYTTDFRSISDPAPSWTFEVRGNPVGDTVYLRWEGDPAALKASTLTNVATGQTINVSDPRFMTAGLPIKLTSASLRFIWTVQNLR